LPKELPSVEEALIKLAGALNAACKPGLDKVEIQRLQVVATLARDTTAIVAFNLQRLARRLGEAVIPATTHNDLFEDLAPSVHVHKRFGEEIAIKYYPNQLTAACSLLNEMVVEHSSLDDWRRLSVFHYRRHFLGAKRKVFSVRRQWFFGE
jgi:hypothetical protein